MFKRVSTVSIYQSCVEWILIPLLIHRFVRCVSTRLLHLPRTTSFFTIHSSHSSRETYRWMVGDTQVDSGRRTGCYEMCYGRHTVWLWETFQCISFSSLDILLWRTKREYGEYINIVILMTVLWGDSVIIFGKTKTKCLRWLKSLTH
jgi:hypothetical protein